MGTRVKRQSSRDIAQPPAVGSTAATAPSLIAGFSYSPMDHVSHRQNINQHQSQRIQELTSNTSTLPNSTMDPPTYEATAATITPQRNIQDLRAQIIAHGTVLAPSFDSSGSGYNGHIEVLVAKTPAVTTSQPAYKTTNFSEKQSMRPDGTFDFQPAASRRTQSTASSSTARPAGAGGKHYAVLVRQTASKSKILIILKGEPKDTVEEALEWMLEKTEMMMHDAVVRRGRQDEGDCVVM